MKILLKVNFSPLVFKPRSSSNEDEERARNKNHTLKSITNLLKEVYKYVSSLGS